MPLIGEAKKIYQREYMRLKRSNQGKGCEACGSKEYIHLHHPDYSKPLELLRVCAACHKKLHLFLVGKQRKSYPYINPLEKIARKQPKPIINPCDWITGHAYHSENIELDADGNIVPELT